MSDSSNIEEIRSQLRKIADRRSLRDVAGEVGVSHTTLYGFVGGDAPSERTERLVREWLSRGTAEGEEGHEWVDDMLRVVRYAQGEHPMDDAERRRVQFDMLGGMIRLGRDEGRDVGRLEALRDELGRAGVAPPPVPNAAAVLAFYERESRAAEERAVGMKEWAVAVRIAEEESRARRSGVSSAQETRDMLDRARQMVDEASKLPPLGTGEDPPPPTGPRRPRAQ